jgi:hypothetical protein
MHDDEIESKSWISYKFLTIKLSQGKYNEKLYGLKIFIHRLEFVSHMTSCDDPLGIFSKNEGNFFDV